MRNALWILVLVLVAGCASVAPPLSEGCPADVENVWLLDGPTSSGSCAPILCEQQGERSWRIVFLTAKHVVEDDSYLCPWMVTNARGEKFEYGIRLAMHPTKDVALVSFTTDRPIPVFQFTEYECQRGDPAWVVGYPLARYLSVTKGYIGERFHVSAPIIFGNSGGPVLDWRGRILGVANAFDVFRGMSILHMARFVPIQDVRSWILGTLRR